VLEVAKDSAATLHCDMFQQHQASPMRVLAAFDRPSSVMIASTMALFSALLTDRGSRRLAATSKVSRTCVCKIRHLCRVALVGFRSPSCLETQS
jgi:hypothetical protein